MSAESPEIEHIRARVTDARDAAALRLPGLTGESAATVRGWAAAMDEVLAFLPSPPANGCACEAYTIRTDYGTGIEYDVDRSSCPIHDPDGDGGDISTPPAGGES